MSFGKAIFGPRLYRIHKSGTNEGSAYIANRAENWSDTVIKCIRFAWSTACWGSPVLLFWMYRREMFTSADNAATLVSYGVGTCIVVVFALFVRGVGRWLNSDYQMLLRVLTELENNPNSLIKKKLQTFDFEMTGWPVDFKSSSNGTSRTRVSASSSNIPSKPLLRILGYVVVKTFGLRMLYPGCTSLVNTLVAPHLLEGRRKMIEEMNGVRAKLSTADGNNIDTMFIDRRDKHTEQSNILVVCSEGNAGFYEIGCTATPLEAGYSVIGWNRPGFGESTGTPLPSAEQNAIDTVMQYAIEKLKFKVEDIVLFAWSIGGYAATWAAMHYPDVRYLILDATFDDVLPLAHARMPASWSKLTEVTVRSHLNLDNVEQICRYPGPVLIVRRSRDEMISTEEGYSVASNRGNVLLRRLLEHRYPNLFNESSVQTLQAWLAADKTEQSIHDEECETILRSYVQDNSASFPCLIGDDLPPDTKQQILLYLASKHLEEFDSTHCTPLPSLYFRPPWSLASLN